MCAAAYNFSEKNVTVVAQNLDDNTIAAASTIPIHLARNRIHNDNLHRDLHTESEFIPVYEVQHSPVWQVNGTYLQRGRSCDAPKYEHVRGWVIMRCLLPEIEELGICARDAYNNNNNNTTRLEKFFKNAG